MVQVSKNSIYIWLSVMFCVFAWLPPYQFAQENYYFIIVLRILIGAYAVITLLYRRTTSLLETAIILYGTVAFVTTFITLGLNLAMQSLVDPLSYLGMAVIMQIAFRNNKKTTLFAIFSMLLIYAGFTIIEMDFSSFTINTNEIDIQMYLIGGKFDTAYLFMILFYVFLNVCKESFPSVIENVFVKIFVSSVFGVLAIKTGCATGILGMFLIIIFVVLIGDKFSLKRNYFPYLILLFDLSAYGLHSIIKLDIVQQVILALGKDVGMTGRLKIYELTKELITTDKLFIGYGYNSMATFDVIGFANTQNGIMQKVFYYGIFGAIAYLFIIHAIGKKILYSSKYNQKITFAIFIGFVLCSMVEITFENLFMFFMILTYVISDTENTDSELLTWR